MISAEALASGLKEGLKDLKPVTRELLEQFGISKDNDFQGLIPLSLLLYPAVKELLAFLHDLYILERQIMTLLEGMGSSIENATSSLSKSSVVNLGAPPP